MAAPGAQFRSSSAQSPARDCALTGEPMYYNGTQRMVNNAIDARMLGRAMVWATEAPTARDQRFNIDNGDCYLMEKIERMGGA